ncbi:hypothetical protein TpMuguga_02g00815 [Theileria parva strain Muguga]|uniref:Uncharacterized protein n=1 Tax=Theileria parva TaxID=5875 RepID=Q4N423_THEPA|nr:uncharacterized protein TpMuguga_02g00815 [Theileria parva strain Muguga]EAN33100.1 hypothetical protein TpMuguga_02g00815 [Theileria parva strain Muguga]|eukprot:XP_765383.1 hypothetical protein [Theileria parva strain Muguga]
MDHNDYFEPEIAKQFSAFGVWNNDHSIVFHHKGSTFHRLSLGRSFSNSSLYLTLEETIFALLRTDFVLVDNNTKVFVTPEKLIQSLENNNRLTDLLTVHVYLAFQRFGKCPKPLKEVSNPEMRFFNPEPVLSISSLPKKRDKVELQSLLKVFQKNLTSQILDFKTSLPLPSFTVDNVQVFAAMPDSPAFSILETLNNFNCIVSVSNLESVYFLTLSPFKINT